MMILLMNQDKVMGTKESVSPAPILLPFLHVAEGLNLKSESNVSRRVRHYRLSPGKDKSKQERAGEKRWRKSQFQD
jgi:hypothetical protein